MVPPVPPGDDADIIRGTDLQALNPGGKGVADHPHGLRETLGIGKGNAVVHNGDSKIQHGSHGAQRHRNVAAAQQNQPVFRQKNYGIGLSVHDFGQLRRHALFQLAENFLKFQVGHGSFLRAIR